MPGGGVSITFAEFQRIGSDKIAPLAASPCAPAFGPRRLTRTTFRLRSRLLRIRRIDLDQVNALWAGGEAGVALAEL